MGPFAGDRTLLVTAYWGTNLTMRQLPPLFGISKSAVDLIIDHLGPLLALQPRHRFAKDAVLIVDGTLVPIRDHEVAEQSKNHRYSTNHQVVIDADTRLVLVVGQPLSGNRNDCKAWGESGAKAAVGHTMTIADAGYPGTGLVMPHRRRAGEELTEWKQEHNRSHKQVRARVEHAFAPGPSHSFCEARFGHSSPGHPQRRYPRLWALRPSRPPQGRSRSDGGFRAGPGAVVVRRVRHGRGAVATGRTRGVRCR